MSELASNPRGRLLRLGALGGALVFPPWLVRALLVGEKIESVGSVDLRGYASDLVVALTLLIACLVVVSWSRRPLVRGGLAGFGAAWGLLNLANYEHVKVLDAPLEANYAAFLGDSTFLEGSVLSTSHPVAALLILVGSALGVWWGSSALLSTRTLQVVGASTVAGWLVVVFWPAGLESASWRRANFLYAIVSNTGADEVVRPSTRVARVEPPDLEGEPLISIEPRRHNVLIIMLEGISGGHLPSQAKAHGFEPDDLMPELEGLYRGGVSVPGFIANQRQTNRGEYAILCGDYPKLTGDTAKMSEYVHDELPPCLPSVLRDAGYATAYLQSAPLGFMLKDQFMRKAGFETVLGADRFREGRAKNGWGIDDLSFFEQSYEVLSELDGGERPWFAVLLTVGTHHPYLVPDDFEAPDGSAHQRSLRYADHALARLMGMLQKGGMLEDTLVVVTSDESAGLGFGGEDLTRAITHNWGIFTALLPGGEGAGLSREQPFAHSDVALSIMDYLGQDQLAKQYFGGRSIFRDYGEPRPIRFANAFTHRVFELGADGTLLACDEALSECTSYALERQDLMASRTETGAASDTRIAALRDAVQASLARRSLDTGPVTLDLFPPDAPPFAVRSKDRREIVFGGQFFALSPGRTVSVELELHLEGKGRMAVSHDLAARSREVLVQPHIGPLESGDRVTLKYTYTAAKDLYDVGASLWAQNLWGKPKLVIERARVTLRDDEVPEPFQRSIEEFEIHRKRKGWKVDLGKLATNDCVKVEDGKAQVEDCPSTEVVYGPYRIAPRGSDVQARFVIRGERARGSVRVDVASDKGRTKHVEGPKLTLGDKDPVLAEISWTAERSIGDLEVRLRWMPEGEGGSFVIEEARVEVTYPTSPVQPRD